MLGARAAATRCRSRATQVCLHCSAAAILLWRRVIRAHRGRRHECTKSLGGSTLASRCSIRVRRLQPRTSVSSPTSPLNTCSPAAGRGGLSAPPTGLSRHLLRVRVGPLALSTRGRSGAQFGVREAMRDGRSEEHGGLESACATRHYCGEKTMCSSAASM